MEELHLKRLSPGLGFAEKQRTLKQEAQDSQAFQQVGPLPIPSVPKDLLLKKINFDEPDAYDRLLSSLKNPWLNENTEKDSTLRKTIFKTTTSSSSIPVAPHQKIWPQALSTTPTSKYTTTTWPQQTTLPTHTPATTHSISSQKRVFLSLKSLFIDSLCSAVLFFSSLYTFIFLTHSQPMTVFTSLWLEITFGFLFFHQIYQMAWRLFCFETYGETLTHRRLTYMNNINKEVHPLLHLWRLLLITMTGFITFSLLSIIFKRDLTGTFTGLYFQKTNTE